MPVVGSFPLLPYGEFSDSLNPSDLISDVGVFLPADYGVIQIVYAYIAILNIFYIYGMDSAFLKFAAFKDVGDEKDNFSTPYISVFLTSLLFSFLIIYFKESIAVKLGIPPEYHYLLYLAVAIIFLDTCSSIPFLKLRLNREAKKFSIIKILNIVSNLALNLYLILVLHWACW